MTHLLTDDEIRVGGPWYDANLEAVAKAQLAKTLSELSAFPGESRYIAVPREWIEEAKKELVEE